MDGARDHVRELVKLKSALVRNHCPRVSQGKPGRHDVLVRARRKLPQAEKSTADPLVAPAWAGVIAKRAAVHARIHGLGSREIPCLRLGQPIKTFMIYVRHKGDLIT
jgi:hypothetical protein